MNWTRRGEIETMGTESKTYRKRNTDKIERNEQKEPKERKWNRNRKTNEIETEIKKETGSPKSNQKNTPEIGTQNETE